MPNDEYNRKLRVFLETTEKVLENQTMSKLLISVPSGLFRWDLTCRATPIRVTALHYNQRKLHSIIKNKQVIQFPN